MGKMKFNGGKPQQSIPKQEIVEKIIIQEKIVEVPVTIEKIIEIQKEPIQNIVNETIVHQVIASKDEKARKHSILLREGIQKELQEIRMNLDKCVISHDGNYNNLVDMIEKLDQKQVQVIDSLQAEIETLKNKKVEEKQIVIPEVKKDNKLLILTIGLFALNLLITLLK